MGVTLKAVFPSRREVELAIEHLVQEYGIPRADVFVEPAGDANSSGQSVAGADAESGHAHAAPDAGGAAYRGPLSVSVDINGDEISSIDKAFRDAGASDVGTV